MITMMRESQKCDDLTYCCILFYNRLKKSDSNNVSKYNRELVMYIVNRLFTILPHS